MTSRAKDDPPARRPARDDLAQFTLQDEAGITIASLAGELDMSNARLLSNRLQELPNHAPGLIVDLSAIGFLDSSGIALLHDLSNRLAHRSQELIVICPATATARRVIELTGLGLRVPIADDRASAIAQLVK